MVQLEGFDDIKYIENPNEKVCLEAVRLNGNNIQYIKNPTDEMKILMLKTMVSQLNILKIQVRK